MRNRDYIYKCLCNYCGSSTDVFCDTIKDEHICSECLNKEEEECKHQWEYLALGKHKQCSQCEIKLPIDLKEN